MIRMKNAFMTCMTLAISANGFSQSLDNTFDLALGTAGTNIKEAQFDAQMTPFFQFKYRSSLLYDSMSVNPWRTPYMMQNLREQLSLSSDRMNESITAASRSMGLGVRRSLINDPVDKWVKFAERPGALVSILEKMKAEGLLAKPAPSATNVPEPVRSACALILSVLMDTAPMRRATFANNPDLNGTFVRSRSAEPTTYDADRTVRSIRDMETSDMRFIVAASQDIASAVSRARTRLLGVDRSEKFRWVVETVWGNIILSGGTNDTYDSSSLLIIDTSGDDTYIGLPTNQSVRNWASIAIDVRGNDKYLSTGIPANRQIKAEPTRKNPTGFGPVSATCGIAMLFDMQGDDLYRTTAPGIASANFGVAALVDSGGNDIYDAYVNSQGFGTNGIGLLEDLSGDDRYEGFNSVQGYGGPGGFGAILDRVGKDSYIANNTEKDFPSPQDAQHNTSMAQGAGVGRRADFLDGTSMSGGIGILQDGEGDDKYSCGVFGQGVGYWDGIGSLFDRTGNDTYSGVWYCQGTAAHFGFGYLEDEFGTDTYSVTQNMGIGAGHDFGVGMLLDKSGNDIYKGPNLSLGAGNSNGIGVLMDFAGDDQYDGSNITLGRSSDVPAGSMREKCMSVGIFYDGGGADKYPASTNWARQSVRIVNWTDRGNTALVSRFGIFWDR